MKTPWLGKNNNLKKEFCNLGDIMSKIEGNVK